MNAGLKFLSRNSKVFILVNITYDIKNVSIISKCWV